MVTTSPPNSSPPEDDGDGTMDDPNLDETQATGSTTDATTGKSTAGSSTTGSNSTGSSSSSSSSSTQSTVQMVGSVIVKTLVAGTRNVLVPLAEVYARSPTGTQDEKGDAPANSLTSNETAALARAAAKFVIEAGDLLMANFSPVPQGDTYTAPVADENGRYGEPSLAMLVSAVKAVMAVQASRTAKKQAKHEAKQEKEQADAMRPVTIQTLRAVRRG